MTTEIRPEDDSFHRAGPDPFWAETYWFEFWVPEARLSATVYPWFRPNLGLAACCIALWDDTASSPWDVPLYDYQWHLPMPDGDLTDLRLSNGLSIHRKEPGIEYELCFAPETDVGVQFEVTFRGIHAPHYVGTEHLDFAGVGHYDQQGRVTGTLQHFGNEVAVDCFGMRDRSWGPRHTRRSVRAGYVGAVFSETEAFHLITTTPDDRSPAIVAGGYLMRDGELAAVAGGERHVVERSDDGAPRLVTVALTDELERTLDVEGECLNALAHTALPNNLSWMCLTRFEHGGAVAFGEDQDVFSLDRWHEFRSHQRREPAAVTDA